MPIKSDSSGPSGIKQESRAVDTVHDKRFELDYEKRPELSTLDDKLYFIYKAMQQFPIHSLIVTKETTPRKLEVFEDKSLFKTAGHVSSTLDKIAFIYSIKNAALAPLGSNEQYLPIKRDIDSIHAYEVALQSQVKQFGISRRIDKKITLLADIAIESLTEHKFLAPKNYRENSFQLFEQNLLIAGMAGPHNNPSGQAFKFLKEQGRVVLIGLHEKDFTAEACSHGLEYYHIPVNDFASTPIPVVTYDAIYDVIKKASEEGKKVSIHCGAGDGRTGTVLASLKLRELIEAEIRSNPNFLDEEQKLDCTVIPSSFGNEVRCSRLVKDAIDEIRAVGSSGARSVETPNDIQTLINYEHHLKLVLKDELVMRDSFSLLKPSKMEEVSEDGFAEGKLDAQHLSHHPSKLSAAQAIYQIKKNQSHIKSSLQSFRNDSTADEEHASPSGQEPGAPAAPSS